MKIPNIDVKLHGLMIVLATVIVIVAMIIFPSPKDLNAQQEREGDWDIVTIHGMDYLIYYDPNGGFNATNITKDSLEVEKLKYDLDFLYDEHGTPAEFNTTRDSLFWEETETILPR